MCNYAVDDAKCLVEKLQQYFQHHQSTRTSYALGRRCVNSFSLVLFLLKLVFKVEIIVDDHLPARIGGPSNSPGSFVADGFYLVFSGSPITLQH